MQSIAVPDSGASTDKDLPWTISIMSDIEKTRIRNGIDLSGTNPASNSAITLLHDNGLNGLISWTSLLGSNGGPLSWSAALGYDYSLTDWLDASVTASHTKYLIDSINAISDLENSLSLSLTAELSVIDLDIGYELYPAAMPAHYWTAEASHTFKLGPLSIDLSADITYMSMQADTAKLNALALVLKKKKTVSTTARSKSTVIISGISDYTLDCTFTYNVGSGFKVYFDPSYIVSPKGEVSAKDSQVSWTAGVRYTAEF
jgi:hypothetical protein